MWELFKENVDLVKDIFWILFTLITTTVAVLTYRRAKKTVLQPLRSEVIKRQTDILVELLDFLDGKDSNIYQTIDYYGIIHCNVYMFAKACGFFTEAKDMEDEELERVMQEHIRGKIYIKPDHLSHKSEAQSPFSYPQRISEDEEEQKQLERRVLYKNGVFDNEYLVLTKEFAQFKKTIDSFANSPFIPSEIQKLLYGLNKDILDNITIHIQNEMQSFMQEMCYRMSKLTENKPIQFQPGIIAENFHRSCIKHDETIHRLRKSIREYLMVDKKWS